MRRFRTPPVVEEALVYFELDPVRPQVVGDSEWEAARHDRPFDPEVAHDPEVELVPERVGVQPLARELLRLVALHGADVGLDPNRPDPLDLEVEDRDQPAAADLGIGEGVSDLHRHLVAQIRHPLGVTNDQDVGHRGASYSPSAQVGNPLARTPDAQRNPEGVRLRRPRVSRSSASQ